MKLAIEIPDKDYDKMCKGELVDTILVAIKNGIPIPQTMMAEDKLADFLNKLNNFVSNYGLVVGGYMQEEGMLQLLMVVKEEK